MSVCKRSIHERALWKANLHVCSEWTKILSFLEIIGWWCIKTKKAYFIHCLRREFTHYGFKFKTPIYQVSRRLKYLDSKLCRTSLVLFGCRLARGLLNMKSWTALWTTSNGIAFNNEFIYDYIKGKLEIVKTKRKDPEMSSNLPEALKLYRAAWLVLTKTEIPIKETDAPATRLGLTGPGNGHLTCLSETLFGSSSTFRLHALCHDVFGRIYWKRRKDTVILTLSETVYLTNQLYLDI